MPRVKKCFRCKQELPINEFYKRKTSRDGRNGICKICSEHAWKGKPVNRFSEHLRCEDSCAFFRECKHSIWRKTFDPYCFIGSRYHDLYLKEYA
jgi:hypothetical protein